MAAKKWVGTESNLWNKAKNWSPEGLPALTSDIKFEAGAPNCEISAAAKCRSVDCTGYTGTLTHKVGAPLSIGTTTAPENGIALKFVAGMTYSGPEAEILLVGTSGTVEKIFCGGLTLGTMSVESKASIKLEDEHRAVKVLLAGEGTLDTNGQTCEWDFASTSGAKRLLKLGASLIKLTGKATVWNFSGEGSPVLEAGTSALEVTDAGASTKKFNGGGKTYHDLILAGQANLTGNMKVIEGSNTFHKIALNCPNTESGMAVGLESGSTQTVEELTTTAKSGAALSLKRASATPAKLSKASGNVSLDWLNITDVETDNSVSWYAGANSTLTGATSFWKKEAPGGAVSLAGTIAVQVGASGTAGDKQGLGGTIKVVAGSSALAGDKQGLGGTISVRVGSAGTATNKESLAGTVKVVFGASGTVTTKTGSSVNLSGAINLIFGASAKASVRQGLGGTVKVTTNTTAKAGDKQGLGGVIHLTTAAVATPRVKVSVGGTMAVLFGASASITTAGGAELLPCLMVIANGKQATMTVVNGKQVAMTIVNHKASQQTLVNL